jgi:hypothetical protein
MVLNRLRRQTNASKTHKFGVCVGRGNSTVVNVSDPSKIDNAKGRLLRREGRGATEQRVIQEAQQDPVFAHNLVARPRQTLEAFLGVKIPETVSLAPIIEDPRRVGLVIPMADNYLPPAD